MSWFSAGDLWIERYENNQFYCLTIILGEATGEHNVSTLSHNDVILMLSDRAKDTVEMTNDELYYSTSKNDDNR